MWVIKIGRTVPTFRKALEKEIEKWEKFQEALRKEERKIIDRILNYSRKHVSAGSQASRPEPFRTMLMSILLEQEKEIRNLRKELDEIREG